MTGQIVPSECEMPENVYLVITSLLAVSTIFLVYYLFKLRKNLKAYEEEVSSFISMAEQKENFRIGDFDLRLQVEVKDPLAVAKRESGLARVAAGPAPHVVKRKCYEEVARQTIEQFNNKEIDVDVKIVII